MSNSEHEPGLHSGTKLFQITSDDLADLERILPEMFDPVVYRQNATPRQRALFVKVKNIISNIRWDYGPPTEVEHIPCDGDQ